MAARLVDHVAAGNELQNMDSMVPPSAEERMMEASLESLRDEVRQRGGVPRGALYSMLHSINMHWWPICITGKDEHTSPRAQLLFGSVVIFSWPICYYQCPGVSFVLKG